MTIKGKMDQYQGPLRALSLLRRLIHRSGVMTFESTNDAGDNTTSPSPRIARVARLVDQHLHGGNVLDIGCWTGGLARALKQTVEGNRYTGVDIEPATPAVEAARRAMPDHSFVIVSSIEALPFHAESFDVVVLTEVIEHVATGRESHVLAELARVLRPGGTIILSTPLSSLLNPLDLAWYFGHRHYSIAQMTTLSQRSGLGITDVEYSGGIWMIVDTNLLYFYKHVLHRPYSTPRWLYARTRREGSTVADPKTATTLWCRLVRPP